MRGATELYGRLPTALPLSSLFVFGGQLSGTVRL